MNTERPILIDFLNMAAGLWMVCSLLFGLYHIATGIMHYSGGNLDRNVALRTDAAIVLEDRVIPAQDKTFGSRFLGEGTIHTVSNNKQVQLIGHLQQIIVALFSGTMALLLWRAVAQVRSERPFTSTIIRHTRIAGWVLIAYQFVDMGSRYLTSRVLDLQELFGTSGRISLDTEIIALGIVFLVLAELLQHAHEIEEEQQLTV